MATNAQIALVFALYTNDFGAYNGADPREANAHYTFDAGDFTVWSDCLDNCNRHWATKLPRGKALGGLVSSAAQAGLVTSNGECVSLTAAGFALVCDIIDNP